MTRKMPPMQQRGLELATLRKRANLRQRDAAAAVDVTPQAISEWENGKSSPSWQRLRALDEAYGAGGAVLALFDDEREFSRYDELARRCEELQRQHEEFVDEIARRWERLVRIQAVLIRVVCQLGEQQGVDVAALRTAD